MAAAATEDDEGWLYGGKGKKTAESSSAVITEDPAPPGTSDQASEPAAVTADTPADSEQQQENKDTQDEKDEGEDSDDSDDVMVTIGDIKTQTSYDAPKFKVGYQRPGQAVTSAAAKGQTKGIDIDAVGTINNVSVYEFELDSIQERDRPWRKPGADITDYFNYGFNEETWKIYCDRQKELRTQNNVAGDSKKYMPYHGKTYDTPSYRDKDLGDKPRYSPREPRDSDAGRRAFPPPHRKMGGSIDVIGASKKDSRRPANEDDFGDGTGTGTTTQDNFSTTSSYGNTIHTTTAPVDQSPMSTAYPTVSYPPPPGVVVSGPPPDMMMPPPNMSVAVPPTGVPPPMAMTGPPPGVGVPPPGFSVGPPPGYFGPPPGQGAPPNMGAPPPGFAGPPPGFGPGPGPPPPGFSGPPGWPPGPQGPPAGFPQDSWIHKSDSELSSEEESFDRGGGGGGNDDRRNRGGNYSGGRGIRERSRERRLRRDRSRSRERDRGEWRDRDRDRGRDRPMRDRQDRDRDNRDNRQPQRRDWEDRGLIRVPRDRREDRGRDESRDRRTGGGDDRRDRDSDRERGSGSKKDQKPE